MSNDGTAGKGGSTETQDGVRDNPAGIETESNETEIASILISSGVLG